MAKGVRYKLLKDLPDLAQGAIFTKDMIGYTHRRVGDDGRWVYSFSEESMERNKDWFELCQSE